MRKIKIGIIPPRTSTGEYRYSKYLINGLIKRNFNVEIINNKFFRSPNVKIFLGSYIINRIIKNTQVNIIHNLDNLGPYLFNNNNNKIERVLTVHDIAPIILPSIYNKIVKYNFNNILPRIITNSDLIIVPSYSTKNDLLSYFNLEGNKIHVIPMGIDLSVFYPRSVDPNILFRYGINNKYILYVGTNNPRKNLKNLILAFLKIADKIPHDLVLIGPMNKVDVDRIIDAQYSSCSDYVLKRIVIPGYVDGTDLPVIYSGASVFVFPSLYEGFGLPPLEAMACGTPVILSSNSSLTEVAGDKGVYINNPYDFNEIATHILQVINNEKLRNRLIQNGMMRAKQFSWEKTIDKTCQSYKSLF